VWNHPWVLKLDEDRQLERAERAAMYGLSDSEPDDDDDDVTLGGFIVDSDESSNASSIKTRAKVCYVYVLYDAKIRGTNIQYHHGKCYLLKIFWGKR
jgi:hypothetical protein